MKWINSWEEFSLARGRLPYSCYDPAPSLPFAFSSHGSCLEMLPNVLQVSMPYRTGGTALPIPHPPLQILGRSRVPWWSSQVHWGPPSGSLHRPRLPEYRGIMGGGPRACFLGKEKGRGAARAQRPPEGTDWELSAQEPWSLRSGFHSLAMTLGSKELS